jgi:hypothetical protein
MMWAVNPYSDHSIAGELYEIQAKSASKKFNQQKLGCVYGIS